MDSKILNIQVFNISLLVLVYTICSSVLSHMLGPWWEPVVVGTYLLVGGRDGFKIAADGFIMPAIKCTISQLSLGVGHTTHPAL